MGYESTARDLLVADEISLVSPGAGPAGSVRGAVHGMVGGRFGEGLPGGDPQGDPAGSSADPALLMEEVDELLFV